MKLPVYLTIVTMCGISSASVAEQLFDTQIEARQASFKQIETSLDEIEDGLDSDKVDWAMLTVQAEHLAAASSPLKMLFPQGSHENSRAKEKIWKESALFQSKLEQLDSTILKLLNGVKQQDLNATSISFEKLDDTCSGCHRKYRSLW